MSYKIPLPDAIVFDCDSTLSAIEGIDELAALKNCRKQIAELTNQAMNGEVALEDVYSKRLEIIRPRREDMAKIAELYCAKICPDAQEVLAKIRSLGLQTAIVSGGMLPAVLPLGEKLGFAQEDIFAVDLDFDACNEFVRVLPSPLTTSAGKLEIIKDWKSRKQIKSLVMIGDGASDLAAKGEGAADYVIGYGGVVARRQVQEEADFFTAKPSLLSILDFFL